MSSSSDRFPPHHYDIPLLNDDGNDFVVWKFRVQLVLKLRDLWTVVDGTWTKPDVTVDRDGSVCWTRRDLDALAQISFTLKDGPLTYVVGVKSAKECWERLLARYEGTQNTALLMEELFRTTLSESKPLEPQVNTLVRVARTLNTLGIDLEDKVLAYIIVLKLPDSMTTLKTTLFDIGASEISTEAVVSQIVLDEQRRVRASGVGTAAYFARAAERGQSASKGREKKCTHCNKRGHNVSDCRKLKREQESRGVRNSSVSSAAAPPAPANTGHAASPSGDNTSLAGDAELTIGVAIVCSDTEDVPSTVTPSESTADPELKLQWMMGTAATHTMCPNRSWFSDFSPLASPVQVALGGPRTHRATGTGTGTVPVRMRANLQWHHEVLEDVLFVPDLRRNILSVPQLVDRGASVQFSENKCQLYDGRDQLTCEGRSQGGIYLMDIQPTSPGASSIPESNASPSGGDEF
jgi:hypothetical protein